MLLDEQDLVLVKVLENKIVIEEALLLVVFTALVHLVELLVEFLRPLRDVVQRVVGVHELDHRLRVLLELGWLALDEKCQRQVVEDVLVELVFGVFL